MDESDWVENPYTPYSDEMDFDEAMMNELRQEGMLDADGVYNLLD